MQANLNNGIGDKLKDFVERSISYGRGLQSSQTGYIHYYYHSTQEEAQQTIPLLENSLFALSLFRSKLIENITEAKGLLENLLAFQCQQAGECKGNFPVYLHEYPKCKDPYLGIHLLAPFYWILRHFGHILGSGLKKKLGQTASDILIYGEQWDQKNELPYSIAVRFAAAQKAYGDLFSHSSLAGKGSLRLEHLHALGHVDSWHMTEYLSDLLVALQMVYPSIQNSPWKSLWHYISETWHCWTNTYVGPNVREEQRQKEPQIGLYDFFLSYFAGNEAKRIQSVNLSYLHAALIQPSLDQLESPSLPSIVEGEHRHAHWMMLHHHEWVCTLLEKKEIFHPNVAKSYTPFCFVWGDLFRIHTFVYQSIDETKVFYTVKGEEITLFFHLESEVELDSREKQREINFYLDFHPEMKILIEDQQASTFGVGQVLTIQSGSRILSMKFECIEGEGQFFGHVMRGNRPSQINNKDENRFQSYDWHLFVRTVRRQGKCILKAELSVIK